MELLPQCGLIPCCFAGFEQRAVLVKIQNAGVVHDVLVVFPELEPQLPRRLLDGGARPSSVPKTTGCPRSSSQAGGNSANPVADAWAGVIRTPASATTTSSSAI